MRVRIYFACYLYVCVCVCVMVYVCMMRVLCNAVSWRRAPHIGQACLFPPSALFAEMNPAPRGARTRVKIKTRHTPSKPGPVVTLQMLFSRSHRSASQQALPKCRVYHALGRLNMDIDEFGFRLLVTSLISVNSPLRQDRTDAISKKSQSRTMDVTSTVRFRNGVFCRYSRLETIAGNNLCKDPSSVISRLGYFWVWVTLNCPHGRWKWRYMYQYKILECFLTGTLN